MARVSIVRWNLKEAGGKVPSRWTRTAYKAMQGGRVCHTKRSPKDRKGRNQISVLLPEPCSVNAAAAWDEGYWPLPGEIWTIRTRMSIQSNPYSDVWLNVQKSAEVIVPWRGSNVKDNKRSGKDQTMGARKWAEGRLMCNGRNVKAAQRGK